jgi:hypothetical protein
MSSHHRSAVVVLLLAVALFFTSPFLTSATITGTRSPPLCRLGLSTVRLAWWWGHGLGTLPTGSVSLPPSNNAHVAGTSELKFLCGRLEVAKR